MGQNVAYSDIPEGFMIGGQQPAPSFSDVPEGFMVGGQTPKPDMFDTISDQALQGATFGLGNRAQAGLAALIESGINGKPISENYEAARNIKSQQLRNEMQENPVNSVASNIGGALATGGLGADTAAGSAIANSLRTGSLPLRIAKGAGAGALSGAAYGAGTADYGQSEEGAKQGAITGAVTGGAVPAVGAALSDVANTALNTAKGIFAKSPEAVQDVAAAFKSGAGNLYTQMRQIGATFTPQATQNLISDIGNAVASNQFIPQLNPKTVAIVDHIKDAAANGTLGLNDLDQYRRILGRVGATEDGVSAGKVRQAIDNFVNNAGQKDLSAGTPQAFNLLNEGRKQYAQASKFENVADILTKAAGDPNKIKAGLTRFLNNEDNTKGWSAQEIQALKDAASTGGMEKLLKMGGKFGLDLGTSLTPGNTILPAISGYVNPIVPLAGTASRQAQKYAARGSAQNLLNVIEKGGSGTARTPISGLFSAPAAGLAAESENARLPATGGIGDQNMQELQKLKSQMPQSNAADFFQKEQQAESGNNPNAKNPNSSASGAFQFTDTTWKQMVKRYGDETGIKESDKSDPQAQATMAKLYAKDNINRMQPFLKRNPTKGELYMAHVFGADGALRLIQAANDNPNKQAIMLFPRAVTSANKNIFFNGNTPRTVLDVYQRLAQKVA